MLRLTYSNRPELNLARMAVEIRRRQRRSPLTPIQIVVSHRNVELWIRQHLAQEIGVAANLEVVQLKRFVLRLLEDWSGDALLKLIDSEVLLDQLLAIFFEPGALDVDAALAPLVRYLDGGELPSRRLMRLDSREGDLPGAIGLRDSSNAPLRRFQLASALARLFDEYALSRDFLELWQRGVVAGFASEAARHVESWQAALWRLLRARFTTQGERLNCRYLLPSELPGVAGLALARPTFVFGISHMAFAYHRLFDHLAHQPRVDLGIYALNPCAEFWDELPAGFELGRARRAAADALEHGAEEARESGHPLLQAWGRPGRENIRVLNEMAGCDFEDAFESAAAPETLLGRIQRDILGNAPAPQPLDAARLQGDASLRILSCASLQRECEAVAGEITQLLGGNDSLRFGEVAILVAGRDGDAYFAHLTSALGAFQIPVCLSDVAIEQSSRLAEAARLLVHLPLTRFTRGDVLDVIAHPALLGNVPGLDRSALVQLIDRLGIHYGIDRGDQAESYLCGDRFSWDQGLGRLALGQAMCGWSSGEESPFREASGRVRIEADGVQSMLRDDACRARERWQRESYWPQEAAPTLEGQVGAWLLFVRSLLADARFAARGNDAGCPQRWRTLGEWARFFEALFDSYLCAEGEGQVREKEGLLGVARALGSHGLYTGIDRGERMRMQRVPYRVACELLCRKLAGLRSCVGNFCLDGVSIGLFQPQRALPFRHIFVVGLNAGAFPEPVRRDPLDLRRERTGPTAAQQLHRFDVFERERAQYLFLETLICARERLVLSFVGRDQATGHALDPSPVLAELERVLRLYAPGICFREELPARRCDLALFPSLAALLCPEDAPVQAADFPALPEARREAVALTFRALIERLAPEAARDFLQRGQALTREAFEALIAPLTPSDRAAAHSLAKDLGLLPALSEVGSRAAPECREISLPIGTLRRFLEDPAQASATALLQLQQANEEESEDALARRDDECFSFEDRVLDRAAFLRDRIASLLTEAPDVWRPLCDRLRAEAQVAKSKGKAKSPDEQSRQTAAALEALRACQAHLSPWFDARWADALDRLTAAGCFPAGLFGDAERQKLFDIFAAWLRGLASLENGTSLDYRCLTFGEAGAFDRTGALRTAIDLGEISLPKGKARVRLRGTTGLLGFDGDRLDMALVFRPVKQLKKADQLRGFIDALACLGEGASASIEQGFRCALIGSDGNAESICFQAMTAEAARSYLRGLAVELLRGPNAYWMPAAAVLDALQPRSEDISLGARLTKVDRGNSRGPLRRAEVEALPLPAPGEIARAFFPEGSPSARWRFFAEQRGASFKSHFFDVPGSAGEGRAP